MSMSSTVDKQSAVDDRVFDSEQHQAALALPGENYKVGRSDSLRMSK